MPNNPQQSIENNFSGGLKTEYTGLNFPENACTSANNCVFSIIGDVSRREGINFEPNAGFNSLSSPVGVAQATYKWNNVGGDGLTQLLVTQTGGTLNFYSVTNATITNPLSKQLLASSVNIGTFVAQGGVFNHSLECQYVDGNGYLFVYHPNCDPFYCTYTAGVITANRISISIRDFAGVPEPGVPINARPGGLSPEHQYNLINQGWVSGNPWNAASTTLATVITGAHSFAVPAGLVGVTVGDLVSIYNTDPFNGIPTGTLASIMNGNVTSYSGTTMNINVTQALPASLGLSGSSWNIVPQSTGYINTWNTAIGNYPSNADVWWYFKNSSGVFSPSTTINNTSLATGNAPRGHFILDAFSQQRDNASGLSITDISTTMRPRTGTWFQGRVWYAGVDAQQPATGDAPYYTWTENIYFSQIVNTTAEFGNCYQTNDPTSENLFDILPTDGGVITIQGSGSVYKLFPIQNGLLVFAANGIWFITGSQGIGFSANDYTITKISSIRSISSTSFVDVNGLPYFWNEEGIYSVQSSQGGGLAVEPITVGTILSFYNTIPIASKKYARGYYHPIDYVIQWIYNDQDNNADLTRRYSYDHILNFNIYNKAFFPYSINSSGVNTDPFINGILYVSSPGDTSSTAPQPAFKYLTSSNSTGSYKFTFSDEHDSRNVDWFTFNSIGKQYTSFFVTGYKLHGKGQMRFQIPYLYMYYRMNEERNASTIQGQWDYALTGDTGRWSSAQLVNMYNPNYAVMPKRIKIRGRGLVLQIKVSSVDNLPFDIIGWSIFEAVNTGV